MGGVLIKGSYYYRYNVLSEYRVQFDCCFDLLVYYLLMIVSVMVVHRGNVSIIRSAFPMGMFSGNEG